MNRTMNSSVLAITALYPTSVITMRSALVLYGFLEPRENDCLDLSFPRGTSKKSNELFRVWTLPSHLHKIGATWIERKGYPFLVYDIESLCAIYLLRREEIGGPAFEEACFAFRKMIHSGLVKPSDIKERINLYPNAQHLKADFDRFMLAVA